MSNKIGLKSINELHGMRFFIPNYQRGYRWTPSQVKDLLDDIYEYINGYNNSQGDSFYCLQPLVVKENISKSEKKIFLDLITSIKCNNDDDDVLNSAKKIINDFTKWEVIDGQQRLTTIHILLFYLQSSNDKYTLEYETREESKNFLNELKVDTKMNDIVNIDFFHMQQTFKTIQDWFSNNQDMKNKERKQLFCETLLDKVKFIWYESSEPNPVKVFTRLNIGKIALTNSELIKALLLNRSNFSNNNNLNVHLKQNEIAAQWDKIEFNLQNDEFWLFLNKINYDKPTRIDMIFDIICNSDMLKIGAINSSIQDEYKAFRYFYKYFNQDSVVDKKIKICNMWEKITEIFGIYEEWYNDIELYHYIGFLIENKTNVDSLLNKWQEARFTKSDFLFFLKDEIKRNIFYNKNLNIDNILDIVYEINPNSPKTKCKPILLLHNIQTVIKQNKNYKNKNTYKLPVFYKFPFHLYKLEGWDVEHIDSNTENNLDSLNSQKEYLAAVYLALNEKLQNEINLFIEDGNNWDTLYKKIKDFLPQIPETEKLNQNQKNTICNFTLLDSSTNRGYGNSIFPVKRRIIIDKDKGVNTSFPQLKEGKLIFTEKAKSYSSFIPPCTKQVFMKYYSHISISPLYYTSSDAEEYKTSIRNTLEDFLVI